MMGKKRKQHDESRHTMHAELRTFAVIVEINDGRIESLMKRIAD